MNFFFENESFKIIPMVYKIEKQVDKMCTFDTFYEKMGKIKPASGKEYSKILKVIKEKYGKPVAIRIVDNKKHWAQKPIFSSSIYITKGFWGNLTFKEKLAVIFHEIGHDASHINFYYIPAMIISLLLFGWLFSFFSLSWVVVGLIWLFGRGFAVTVCPISLLGEKFADNFAAKKIGKKYLISALKKFQIKDIPLPQKFLYFLFFYPFKTHPSTEERIKRLKES
jgi:Zn-dependent protease with chaperone function